MVTRYTVRSAISFYSLVFAEADGFRNFKEALKYARRTRLAFTGKDFWFQVIRDCDGVVLAETRHPILEREFVIEHWDGWN